MLIVCSVNCFVLILLTTVELRDLENRLMSHCFPHTASYEEVAGDVDTTQCLKVPRQFS